MWKRADLKARGKTALHRNYWKCVLVALILLVLLGSSAGPAANSAREELSSASVQTEQEAFSLPGLLNQMDPNALNSLQQINEMIDRLPGVKPATARTNTKAITISLGGGGLIMFLLGLLVFNPLQVDCRSFFLKNSRGTAKLSELGRGFKPAWDNVILTMFLRNLFIALWGLLFIIPGIVKSYSYRLVPYLLADHPELRGTQAITVSRQWMNGNKWRTFVLDLSFLGWGLLSALTLGILGVFYVNPYIHATDAELYGAIARAHEGRVD